MNQPFKHAQDSAEVTDNLLKLFQGNEFRLTAEQLQAMRSRINQAVNYHATVGVMGKTGAGKSSLCNTLFGQDVAAVSDVKACTRTPQEITLGLRHGKGISLLDVPGVGESEQRDEEYAALYRDLLPKLDLVLWVIKGDDRALSVDERFYRKIVRPLIQAGQLPVVFVINQVDKIEPCREWNWIEHRPGPLQACNIQIKLASICQAFNIPRSHACTVSAEEGYGLVKLVEKVVRTLPNEKKWSFTREARQENVSAQAQEESTQGLWETVTSAAATILKESWALISSKVSATASRLFGWLW